MIQSRGIDPITGEPDRHGIPQIACPARGDDVNPQFTCLNCPCAVGLETHQAVDDRGRPFHMVDAVECGYDGDVRELDAYLQRFPSLLEGLVEDPPPRLEAGVACPLLKRPGRMAAVSLEIEGEQWVPVGNCRSCQFYRGVSGEQMTAVPGGWVGLKLTCMAPEFTAERAESAEK